MKIALRAVLFFVIVLVWGASQALADGNPIPPFPPNPRPPQAQALSDALNQL